MKVLRQSTMAVEHIKHWKHEAAGKPVRIMQWNILADGLSQDGFLVRDDARGGPEVQDQRIEDVMARVMEAKHGPKEEAEAAMQKVKEAFETDDEKALFNDVLNWKRRWAKIRSTIEEASPDVVTLIEVRAGLTRTVAAACHARLSVGGSAGRAL